ncbi:MAG: hypothetical protein KAS13_07590 [Candidatus Omnitrophica bacterium]|nr:hypothetical protein [Candidatus Omnitrophota bacterium]
MMANKIYEKRRFNMNNRINKVVSLILIQLIMVMNLSLTLAQAKTANNIQLNTLSPQIMLNNNQIKQFYVQNNVELLERLGEKKFSGKNVVGDTNMPVDKAFRQFPETPQSLLDFFISPDNTRIFSDFLNKTNNAKDSLVGMGIISALGYIDLSRLDEEQLQETTELIRLLIEPYLESENEFYKISAWFVLNKIGAQEEKTETVYKLLEAVRKKDSLTKVDYKKIEAALSLLADADIPLDIQEEISLEIVKLSQKPNDIFHRYGLKILNKIGISKEAKKFLKANSELVYLAVPETAILAIELFAKHNMFFQYFCDESKESFDGKIKHAIYLGNMNPTPAVINELKKYATLNENPSLSSLAYALLTRFQRELSSQQVTGINRLKRKRMLGLLKEFDDTGWALKLVVYAAKTGVEHYRWASFYALEKLYNFGNAVFELLNEYRDGDTADLNNANSMALLSLIVKDKNSLRSEYEKDVIAPLLRRFLNGGHIDALKRTSEVMANGGVNDEALLLPLVSNLGKEELGFILTKNLFKSLLSSDKYNRFIIKSIFGLKAAGSLNNIFTTKFSQTDIQKMMEIEQVNPHYMRAGVVAALINLPHRTEKEKTLIRLLATRHLTSEQIVVRVAANFAINKIGTEYEQDQTAKAILDAVLSSSRGEEAEVCLTLLAWSQIHDAKLKEEISTKLAYAMEDSFVPVQRSSCYPVFKKVGLSEKAISYFIEKKIFGEVVARDFYDVISMKYAGLFGEHAHKSAELKKVFDEMWEFCNKNKHFYMGYLIALGSMRPNDKVIERIGGYLANENYPEIIEEIAYAFITKIRLDLINNKYPELSGKKKEELLNQIERMFARKFAEASEEAARKLWFSYPNHIGLLRDIKSKGHLTRDVDFYLAGQVKAYDLYQKKLKSANEAEELILYMLKSRIKDEQTYVSDRMMAIYTYQILQPELDHHSQRFFLEMIEIMFTSHDSPGTQAQTAELLLDFELGDIFETVALKQMTEKTFFPRFSGYNDYLNVLLKNLSQTHVFLDRVYSKELMSKMRGDYSEMYPHNIFLLTTSMFRLLFSNKEYQNEISDTIGKITDGYENEQEMLLEDGPLSLLHHAFKKQRSAAFKKTADVSDTVSTPERNINNPRLLERSI